MGFSSALARAWPRRCCSIRQRAARRCSARSAAADAAADPAGRPRLGLAAGRRWRRCRRPGDGGRRQRCRSRSAISWPRACRRRSSAYLAYLSRPDPAGPEPARVVSGRSAARCHVALRRRAAGAGAAADRRQLRGPARADERVLPAPVARARPSSACKPLSEAQVEALAEFFVAVLPARWRPTGSSSSPSTSISPAASPAPPGGSGATGRTCRRSPIRAGFPLLVALALAASFAPGVLGVAGTSFSGALLFAYLIAGLALMHFIARGRAPWILWLVYAGLLLLRSLRRARADGRPACSSRPSSSGAASAPPHRST